MLADAATPACPGCRDAMAHFQGRQVLPHLTNLFSLSFGLDQRPVDVRGGLCRREASDNAAVSRSSARRNNSPGWDLRCLEAIKATRVMPPRVRQIKRSAWKSGLASLTGCGLYRSNNAASPVAERRSKCLTWQQLGSRFAAVQIARYAAGVAIVTNYDAIFRRQNYIVR